MHVNFLNTGHASALALSCTDRPGALEQGAFYNQSLESCMSCEVSSQALQKLRHCVHCMQVVLCMQAGDGAQQAQCQAERWWGGRPEQRAAAQDFGGAVLGDLQAPGLSAQEQVCHCGVHCLAGQPCCMVSYIQLISSSMNECNVRIHMSGREGPGLEILAQVCADCESM